VNLSSSDKLKENWFEKLDDIDVGQVYGTCSKITWFRASVLIIGL
jgi:hypothetical protein